MGWSGAGFGTFGVGTFWYVWRDGERERVCVRVRVRADAILMRAPSRC